MTKSQELKYWVGFSLAPKIGPSKFKKILNYFPSLQEAYEASFWELKKSGLEENIVQEFITKRREINLDKEMEKLEKEDIKLLTLYDEDYPHLLKEIYNPPYLLYYKGAKPVKDEFSLGIVGTRKASSYGQQVTPEIVGDLTQNGITIVSGLALGIDGLAHQTAYKTGGKTIAVLGSGLDKQNIYPSQHRFLAQKIIEAEGTLISEFPYGTLPLKFNFPYRNRIISGLSLGILVIEAGETSGALITARYALEQNREVFAVPGSIYSQNSLGSNNLIKMGAHAITSASDILDALNLSSATTISPTRKLCPIPRKKKFY